MKKLLFIAIFLTFTSPVYAQEMTVQQQYQSTLRQLIVLLEQQISILMQQLEAIKNQSPALIQETPVVIQPVQVTVQPTQSIQPLFGSITPMTNNTPIVTTIITHMLDTNLSYNQPYGIYSIDVEVKDQFGNNMENQEVNMTSDTGTFTEKTGLGKNAHLNSNFTYSPQSTGTKTLTFSVGGVNTSIELKIK